MAQILDLPEKVIKIIFGYICETENQEYFYFNISEVCKEWNAICHYPQFWKKLDGSLPTEILFHLSTHGSLLNIEELTFNPTPYLRYHRILDTFFKGLPNLKAINFSKVNNLDAEVLTSLARNCKNLCALKMSDEQMSEMLDYSITYSLLFGFINLQGHKLLILDLSSTVIVDFTNIMLAVAEFCFNLEELVLYDIKGSSLTFPLQQVQERCTRIKVLRVGHEIYFKQNEPTTSAKIPGFPQLEVFSYPKLNSYMKSPDRFFLFRDHVLTYILCSSHLLKTLDLRGQKFVPINEVLSLPATHLENLYLSPHTFNSSGELVKILTKWAKSLRRVDLSRMKHIDIDHPLKKLASKGRMCSLEYLDLSYTSVKEETVIHLIENCKTLHTLNLSYCQSLTRGCYRKLCRENEFHSRSELLKLREDLLSELDD